MKLIDTAIKARSQLKTSSVRLFAMNSLIVAALILGTINTIIGNGAWGVAWIALALATQAHVRLEKLADTRERKQ